MEVPFKEYNMVSPDPYRMVRYAGTDQSVFDLVDVNMKCFFPEISKDEYEKYICKDPVFHKMLGTVQKAFRKWYDFDCTGVLLNHNYQRSFNSYVYLDKMNPSFIHIDQLLESIILSFMFITLKWAKDMENHEKETGYFSYLIFLMNELCIFGELPAEDAKAAMMEKMAGDQQIMNLAADCHWGIMMFTAAHEIAHAYQMYTDTDYWKGHLKDAEFNADTIAYDIFLKCIMENPEPDFVMEEYTYLAPMMYMDFFNLYYYTDFILYGTKYCSQTHPTPDERKDALFSILEQEIYQLNTEEGNTVYQWFCMVYDLYTEKLPEYKENGKLDGIIHTERRKRRTNGETGSSRI